VPVAVTEWSDYLCPWCYLGLDRLALLGELGVDVTCLPFELHPDTPAGGRAVRAGGALAARLDAIGAECAAAGLPYRRPSAVPNTRFALSAAEWVRRSAPAAFAALHRNLFRAHFAEGLDIGDASVVLDLVAAAGADPVEVRDAVDRGHAGAAVEAAMTRARDEGVTGTPAWLFEVAGAPTGSAASGGVDRLLVPGAQPRETMRRWVTRLQARAGA
jgi:predicted DsbA family dithiol-disulfide isomerase